MAIRKPSEYFDREKASVENSIQESSKNPEMNTVSDAYNAFKRNLSKVDVLTDFSETLENYQLNIEKVNHLSTKIDEIDEDIKNLLTKEDLDKALISQLLFLEECIRDVQEKVKGINHKNLTQVKLDISSLSETVNIFIDEEIPRYEKLVVESETRLTDKCEVLEEELKDTLDNIKDVIDEKYISDFKSLNEEIDKIKTNDIPKYKNLIAGSEIKTDSKIKEFAEFLNNTVNDVVSKIELVKEDNTQIFDTLNSKVNEVNQIHNLMLEDIEKSENTRDKLDKKILDLEVEILRNESHIESQNKNIEDIHGDVKSAIDRLNIGKIEENNFKLGEKIKYLEEVFEKFSEKELLSENIITEPSSTDNDDPLTPLDKNFVTLDQLQNHYRLFINRIQQQLASLGGGGEVRLEFLDDVDRDSAKVNGKFLKYDSASGKWVGANASGGAGSQTLDETLGLGNTSSRGMSVGVVTSTKFHVDSVGSGVTYNEDLVVVGDGRVTGILSIGTSSIVLDSNTKVISGVEEVQIGETTIKHNTQGEITFVNTINPTKIVNIGIGTSVSVNTTGVITATSFSGNGASLTNVDAANITTGTISDDRLPATITSDITGNAGTATSLASSRNFEITGDVVASAISFDGTGNVSLAATIQPNSVALGTDTTGDYVESVSGTANEIEVTSGTGEGSTPTIGFVANPTIGGNVNIGQDLTVTRDLQVNRNLNVTGTVTIGGTSATIFAETLKITDPDIVLGIRTDANGNDISTDSTASHGGVALASTEGSPLVSLVGTGETLPSTYKKIMWFKTSSFTGLSTDAWLSNYAFGVGTTSMSAGTKFAVGNIEADFDDFTSVRNINSSGVITATTFSGNGIDVTGHTETDTLTVSGVSTFQDNIKLGDGNRIQLGDGPDLDIYHQSGQSYIRDIGSGNLRLETQGAAIVLASTEGEDMGKFFRNAQVELYYDNSKKFETTGAGVTVTGTTFSNQLNVSGVSTFDGNIGINTTNPTEKLDVIGTVKATDFNTTSDQNLKTNIHTIENPIEKVVEIRGVNFEWKENNKPSVGVIAQEVEKVLPELINGEQTKTVNYNGLIGLLIEVVKEQQTQIDSLNERLSRLE